LPRDILKNSFGSLNVLPEFLSGLSVNEPVGIAMARDFMALFLNPANKIRIALGDPANMKLLDPELMS
jgi:hypothetical protein